MGVAIAVALLVVEPDRAPAEAGAPAGSADGAGRGEPAYAEQVN